MPFARQNSKHLARPSGDSICGIAGGAGGFRSPEVDARGQQLLLQDEAALLVLLIFFKGHLVLPADPLLTHHTEQASDGVQTCGHDAVFQRSCSDIDHMVEK
eukprot:CAMPEP_0181447340 /NCGR_PEP_ID=MMETSP1110-20121109/26570_1 /TAXON_ID=174948 /ORGANISM="Symbiodinium sp., Strain CCMP421" /LENGTH=101 /DNA_ID=CAMNT_0023571447 /DNA_START=28 /DNA_END=333 /DNA_ORIENTATION=-